MEDLSLLNYGGIAAAAILKMVIGAIWYSSIGFGPLWMREAQLSEDDLVPPLKPLMISMLSAVLIAFALGVFFSQITMSWLEGGALGIILALGFVAATLAPQFAFEGRSGKLYMIYCGEYIISLPLMGAIIAAI
ncbi:MAG: hypothetical protein CMF31_10505 [Kordiimonas sp.]|nr:hypothetical protein [Kordiimonas sp.]|tara:strand:- start:2176 stop:2577 length:402 start_codon:yes stop_codon:yes gene_type:complete